MCGIAGVLAGVTWPHDPADVARAMAFRLQHRGPDDQGWWADSDARIALAHRRLEVIDTTPGGHQPKLSPGGRHAITFNGEIYNFPELRVELEQSGVTFSTDSDTEVLLAAIEQWGLESALGRAVGMFAFGIWDRQQKRLSLVRDRAGEKPLYYGLIAGCLVFASELKAFQEMPGFDRRIDHAALRLYLQRACVPAPFSIFESIRKVLPGHVLTAERGVDGGIRLQQEAYWRASDSIATIGIAYGDARAEAERLLHNAVRGQMRSDVPLGAFLSGGIDSTAIVALMQEVASTPVRTFSIGSTESAYDEARYAAAVARHLGTDHMEFNVTPEDALRVVDDLPRIYDEPFADSSQIPTILVARLARSRVTVALSGDAGDEVFGGYNRYVFAPKVWSRVSGWPVTLRKGAAAAMRAVPTGTWDRLESALAKSLGRQCVRLLGEKIHKLARVLPATSRGELYEGLAACWMDPPLADRHAESVREWYTIPAALEVPGNYARLMMYLDSVSYLADDILVKVDRASMAVGLESRVPLLDHRLVEFMNGLPLQHKISAGQSKRILRDIAFARVPRALLDRPKAGFGVPIDSWLRGPLRDWAEALIQPARVAADGLFDAEAVRTAWDEHQRGGKVRHHELWAVLMYQAWANEYRAAP